jgi:putative ABC transport system permease protein
MRFSPGRPAATNRWHYPLDYSVFFYLLALSVFAGLLFGLAPALVLSKLDLHASLREGGRGATISRGTRRLSTLLVAGEVALAVVVLAGAGVMIRSFWEVYTADIGVKTDHILTVSLRLPSRRYPDAQAQRVFFERVAASLKSIPGVASLALADSIPGLCPPRLPYELDGISLTDERSRPSVVTITAGPGYFQTLNVPLISWREFSDFDAPSGIPVALVNQQFANQIWPGQNPIGKRLRVFDGKTADAWRTVVGIGPDIVQSLRGRIIRCDRICAIPAKTGSSGRFSSANSRSARESCKLDSERNSESGSGPGSLFRGRIAGRTCALRRERGGARVLVAWA